MGAFPPHPFVCLTGLELFIEVLCYLSIPPAGWRFGEWNSYSSGSSIDSTHLKDHFFYLDMDPYEPFLTFQPPSHRFSQTVSHLWIQFPHLQVLTHYKFCSTFRHSLAHHVSAHVTLVTRELCLCSFSAGFFHALRSLPTEMPASKRGVGGAGGCHFYTTEVNSAWQQMTRQNSSPPHPTQDPNLLRLPEPWPGSRDHTVGATGAGILIICQSLNSKIRIPVFRVDLPGKIWLMHWEGQRCASKESVGRLDPVTLVCGDGGHRKAEQAVSWKGSSSPPK